MKNILMKKHFTYLALIAVFSFPVNALPKIKVEHNTSLQGIPSVRITNETTLILACYIAIDGYKKKFVLQPFGSSRWVSAVSNTYKHTNFSTWCDSLEFHPKYKKYLG
jgi:hypothetical protein